ncbi:MAG: M20/M25/M40 family metallo-hydrolase [Patescibacteria group bacterium]|jgi:tripeptide aminopeptidase
MNNVVDIFLKLVTIDSPSGQEQNMIKYIKNWLDNVGLNYQVDSKGNILAKKPGVGPSILFCVHMDTVEPGKGIKTIVVNKEIIKSSGKTILGADNKAAIASLMVAVEESLTLKSFELLFTVGEENGSGLDNFPFEWVKSKIGFIFDSVKPIGSIILRSPNICLFEAEFNGKASHSSTPENGINALIPAIKALKKIKVGKLDEGETTINIGIINGGTGINILPEKMTVKGEIRSYQKKLFYFHLNKIKSIFKNSDFTTSGFAPGYFYKKTSILIERIKKIYDLLNIKTLYHSYSAVSDANILNSKGIEIINLGDGVENAHTANEQIKIDDLIKLKMVIYKILRNL